MRNVGDVGYVEDVRGFGHVGNIERCGRCEKIELSF